MFEKLKSMFGGSRDSGSTVLSPVAGVAVSLDEVPDPTFSECMLGKGAAVIPSCGRIVSPVAGKVLGIFRTCHAVTLLADNGAELLIHIGIDTVKLDGQHFTPHVVKGDAVKPGQLLIEVDLDAVKAAGYNVITPVLVCNTDSYSVVEGVTGPVEELSELIRLRA